jgi:predicted kinase
MVGVPGSGKSFFAEHFSETFSAPLVSWGNIRNELFNEPTFSRDEELIIARVADHLLDQLMKTKATVLYEGDMITQSARQTLAKKIRHAGYEPLFVWVQTDDATSKMRATKKGVSADIHASAIKRFTPLKETDPFVVISGKHTYASQLKIVLRRLSGERVAIAGQPAARTPKLKTASGNRLRIQ